MDQVRQGNFPRKPRILVAPLDWGLGHATRCIPLIRELIRQGAEPWLAGEGAQQNLLQAEFPQLNFLNLPGYRVRYGRSRFGMFRNIFFQVPSILKAIKNENAWLKHAVKEHQFDAVISDNRYGLYHPDIRTVFMSHQLNIKSPFGKWSERILQKKNYKYINRFVSCWIPDEDGDINLAGELSHPAKKPSIPVHYAGILSRFQKTGTEVKKGHLLFILSGPEPQRTILENKIIAEIAHYPGTASIVRGLPGSANIIPSTNMIRFYNHLAASEMNKEIEDANYIISRCGYSSVMDIVTLKKKSILIPTPGQTEQEYLADYLMKKHIVFSVEQKNFTIESSLKSAADFYYDIPSINDSLLKITVEQFLDRLL